MKERKEREEIERARREGLRRDGKEGQSLWTKIWMGGEDEGWKERRMEEERKALEEGKTYTDLILEQIWEVWNWDKKKGNDETGKGDGKKGE